MIGATFLENWAIYLAGLAIMAAIIGSMIGIDLLRQRWKQRPRNTGEDPLASYKTGWDYCVDGRPIARLTWAGLPEDLNHLFMRYDVSILPGCESEVERWLYQSEHHLPDGGNGSYRSLDPAIAELCSSQVLVGYLGGNRIELKIYPP